MSVLRFLALFGLVFGFCTLKSMILLSGFGVFCSLWCFLFWHLVFGFWQKYEWFWVSDVILNPSQRWSVQLHAKRHLQILLLPTQILLHMTGLYEWVKGGFGWLLIECVYNIAFHYNAANDFYFHSSDRYIRFCQWKNVELNINVSWHLSLKCVNVYLNQNTMYRIYLQSL